MTNTEKGSKVCQLNFKGQRIECGRGLDTPEMFWSFCQEFSPLDTQQRYEMQYSRGESDNVRAIVYHSFNEQEETERILVVGITPKGFLASPQLLLEQRSGKPPDVWAVYVPWARWNLEILDDPEKGGWRQQIWHARNRGEDLGLVVEGARVPVQSIGFKRIKTLLKKWDIG